MAAKAVWTYRLQKQGDFVALTAHDMSDMGRLAQLAVNPGATASREEIYLAVASLYRVQRTGLNDRERELMREILRRLTRDVEMAIRIALAERLAEDATAPHDLILLLVDDRIEVARPLIINSPLLTDDDVLRLIAVSDVGHQEAVAARPHIGVAVTDALVETGRESVLMALVRNVTAQISSSAYESLVEKSRVFTGLQAPLVHRPDLPPQLASKMCEFVSDALKTYIRTNYTVPPGRLNAAMDHVRLVLDDEPAAPQDPPRDSAQRLIEKMARSGQLRASFLMRVLSQGQMDLFDLGFAHLVGMDAARFRKAFYQQGVRPVALACHAAGIDRSVFATVFNLSRQVHGMPHFLNTADQGVAAQVFKQLSRQRAMEELRNTAI
jgi:uncharacterized protein (DUF2336 family)